MADASAVLYRETVHEDPDFVAFFTAVTPVEEISRLRLGSRPAKRRADGGIDDLRAIPWVFSWTQARIILPAWLGLGTGLAAARERHGVEVLREMAATWPFFATLLDNAEMALAKADPVIAGRYVALWDDEAACTRIWTAVSDELERTRSELLRIRDSDRLLERRAGAARVDRSPQPVRGSALLRAGRAAARGCVPTWATSSAKPWAA